MSVKALRKQLLAAVAMVIVAAIAVSSSTFAWFAANTKVEATGMTVSAQSDAIFLEIAGESDTSKTVFSTTGTSTIDADLYPTAHGALSSVADITSLDLNSDSTPDNWYFRYSSELDDELGANPSAITYIDGTTYTLANYVASTTFDVRLNTNSGPDTAYDLIVSDVTIPANKGIHLIVAGPDGFKEFSASATDIAYAASDVLANTVLKTPVKTVTAYIYFDGNDENVYTDNITNLADLGVSFKLEAFTADHV